MLFCIGIGGLLLAACTQESAQLPEVTVTRDITAQVLPMQSKSIDDVFTRANLAMTAAEKEIKTAYVVQFNGTAPTSTVAWVSPDVSAQLKANSPVNCKFTFSGGKNRVYVIANPKTTPTTGTALSAFETVNYSVSTLPSTGLPMAAYQDVTSSEKFSLFQLKCPLVRLTFTTNNTGSLLLIGIPSAYSLVPATPGDSPVRPSGITYTATASLTSGTAYYVPANLSGKVDLPDDIYRCSLFAPADAMYVVNTANNTTYNTYLGDGTTSDFNVVSNCAYAVTANAYHSDGSDLRVGNPTMPNLALDADGTANCYIVTSNMSSYSFSATVMGNGATTPAHTKGSVTGDMASPAITPTALAPASAVVLWETFNTTSAPAKGSVVSDVALSDGRITFRAGTAAGNAVIAVKDAGGIILWSWHIWRLNETPKEIGLNAIGTLTTNGELVLMDRNLGALSAVAGNDLSTGMIYQWGRKDPMPGYGAFSGGAMATIPANIPGTASGGSIATAVANPTTFYTSSSSPYDWCTPRTDNLWGTPLTEKATVGTDDYNKNSGMKSIYDPCPVGWRVPPGYVFANATVANGGTWNRGYSFVIGDMSSYFPASGNRGYSSGTLFNVGTGGCYWTSAPYAGSPTSGSYLYFLSGNVSPANSSYRGFGYGCRCVRE